jgi:sortase A
MTANSTNKMPEFEGPQEFREILSVLVQEKPEDCFRAVYSGTKCRRNVWAWIERALLVSGFGLLIAYGAARLESHLSSRAALKRFATIDPSSTSANHAGAEDIGLPGVDFSLWDEHRVRAHKKSFRKVSNTPLALLRISKIGLEVPRDGTDGLTLNHAVGRISGTARPGAAGNIGIAGHRDGFFRGLKDVGIGDAVELRTPKGTDTYVVDEISIVNPSDVGVLTPRSVPSLTLVTCYPFYFIGNSPQRYIVHASHTGFEPQQRNPTEQGSSLLANEKQEKTQ